MKNIQDRRQWIVIGILVIVVACLAAVIIFGGGAAFLALQGQDNDTGVTEDNNENDSVLDSSDDTEDQDDTNPTTVPYEAVVQIFAYYLDEGDYVNGWTGSGTIISPDGLILTNAHVVLPDKYFPVDALTIALTVEEDQLPVETYIAEVLQADEALDLAVLQIMYDLDWNEVNQKKTIYFLE